MGDAINWECLLAEVPAGEDVNIVSGDKDFRSLLTEDEANEYLENEWKEKKKSSLYFYSKISDYFKDDFPNIKIASEIERDLLIQKLAGSGSFASTHAHIAKLSKHTEFSPSQVEQLVEIPASNNQVGWIIEDDDLRAFFESLLENYGDKIQADAAKKLGELVSKNGVAITDDDGIPL